MIFVACVGVALLFNEDFVCLPCHFLSSTFRLHVFVDRVSFLHAINCGSCFIIQLAAPCLFMEELSLFIFMIIIEG